MARPLSTEAREKILSTAGEILLDTGVSGFTVDEVVRRSGVAKTTIYRHFDTSAQLIVHALDSIVAPFPTPNTGSLRGDLGAYCEITSQITCDARLRLLMLELLAAAAQNPELAKTKRAMFAERMGPVRTIIQLAMARGEISADVDADFATELAEAPFLAHLMIHGLDAPTEAQLDKMIEFVVAGLTGMGSDAAPAPAH
ncbi:MAG: TetR/AcrR family transcriptional regulator [Acidimicrobiia bacterium]|nr:TetR/AcrR family transcriptional regulator [Acidimicrobiia bacterium]